MSTKDEAPDAYRGKRLNSEAQTRHALGNIGRTRLYALTSSGEIRSVKIGRRRFWPDDAIEDFIDSLSKGQKR